VNEESIAAEAALEIGWRTLESNTFASACCTDRRHTAAASVKSRGRHRKRSGDVENRSTDFTRVGSDRRGIPRGRVADRGQPPRVIQITRIRPANRSAELAAAPAKPLLQRSKVRLYGRPGLDYCDLSHIAGFEPVLSLQHPNVMHASFAGR